LFLFYFEYEAICLISDRGIKPAIKQFTERT